MAFSTVTVHPRERSTPLLLDNCSESRLLGKTRIMAGKEKSKKVQVSSDERRVDFDEPCGTGLPEGSGLGR